MATPLFHAVAALALTRVYADGDPLPLPFYLSAACCAIVPDVDIIGLHYGIPYGSLWGHRGLTHSLLAAILVGLVMALAWSWSKRLRDHPFVVLWFFFFLVTVSHPLLDMLTDGGLGVALFSPFNPHRYFFAWRPVHVAPISLSAYAHPRGWSVLKSELQWIGIPSAIIFALTSWRRR